MFQTYKGYEKPLKYIFIGKFDLENYILADDKL